MIVEDRISVSRILRQVGPPLAVLLAYDVTVTALFVNGQRWISVEDLPLSLLGSALAIIVGLRNNSAYARWWEARTLWGSVVNNSRSFARNVLTMVRAPADVGTLVRMQIAWTSALRFGLWKQDPGPALAELPDEVRPGVAGYSNAAVGIQAAMGRHLGRMADAGQLDSMRLTEIDSTLSRLADAQGGLERIRNTPLPRQFGQFQRVFIAAYCLLLPIGLVRDLGIATPIGSTVIGIAFYALDQIGRDLQDPFGGTVHDVPMNAIARTIEVDLRQMLGEHDTPPALAPVEGVLG